LTWLKAYPDATSAQIYDWLQDQCDVQSVSENTVRNEVRLETGHSKLRQKKIQWYHIKFTEGVHNYG